MIIIVLRQPEVDQYRLPCAPQHDVRRLQIQMQYSFAVHVTQCRTYLNQILFRLALAQTSLLFDLPVQTSPFAILHRIIKRVVSLEQLQHFHYMRVVQPAQTFRFPGKLPLIVLVQVALAARGYRTPLPTVEILHEKLLDRYPQRRLQLPQTPVYRYTGRRQVCDPKGTLTQNLLDTITITLPFQLIPRRKDIFLFSHFLSRFYPHSSEP